VLFEQSRALREHALTIFNIGVCQRFLGRYTLARQTLRSALARNAKTSEMPALFVEQATTYLAEIDKKLAHVTIVLTPPTAATAIEGRPLTQLDDDAKHWIAGVAPGGAGKSVGTPRFEVLVDPGAAVFTFTLEGHDTIEIKRKLEPESSVELPVSMTEQPANVRVAADRDHAIVRIDGSDVGMAPIGVSRPPGAYRLTVEKPGFVTYESKLSLRPGQDLKLDAKLVPETVPVTKKWWFWTLAAVIAAGVGVTTYFIVRPEPTRPEVDKGGLGYAAEVR
jgi:hypothetical protein